jgi:hypothetical protein
MKRIYTYLTENNVAQYVIHIAFDVMVFSLLFIATLESLLQAIELSDSLIMQHPKGADLFYGEITAFVILALFTIYQAYITAQNRWAKKFLR